MFVRAARVSGLVSGGGGEDAIKERLKPEKWILRDPEQHSREQQLRAEQREVWYTLTNSIQDQALAPSHVVVDGNDVCFHSIFNVCVCVGP